jgi:hypothetical protein
VASSAATSLLNDMVEQIVYGDGPSAAADLAVKASPTTQKDAAEQAQVRIYAGGMAKDELDAHQQVISILTAKPETVAAVAAQGGGMSNTQKYLIAVGGAAAIWFLFIRKK